MVRAQHRPQRSGTRGFHFRFSLTLRLHAADTVGGAAPAAVAPHQSAHGTGPDAGVTNRSEVLFKPSSASEFDDAASPPEDVPCRYCELTHCAAAKATYPATARFSARCRRLQAAVCPAQGRRAKTV